MKTNRPVKQTRPCTHRGIPLCFLLLLLSLLTPLPSRGQIRNEFQGSNSVVDFTSAELRPMPSPAVITRAREAYFRGDIVRVVGGSAEDMKRLLGVNVATSNSGPGSASSSEVIAVRKINHSMRQFKARITSTGGSDTAAWRKEFNIWRDAKTAQADGVGDPSAPSAAWTLIQQNVYTGSGSDAGGGSTNYTVSIYRLNTIQTAYDYYMVVQDSNAVPNYQPSYAPTCHDAGIGSCGWWTNYRTFSMSAGANALLIDHGPTGTITSESATFNIGATLDPSGPGISAGFSESWSQPSVTTTDHSDNATAAWREDFTGRFLTTPPPGTSTGSFLSHQGAIFRIPFAQNFTLTIANLTQFVFHDLYDNDYYGPDDDGLQVSIPVNPPILSMSPKSQTIAPGQARVASVTATIPGSYQGLSWQVTASPSGLAISQTTGADSANLLVTVEPNTPLGTKFNLNLQTDPPYGAPAVALNPVEITVTAGSPPPLALEGILFAGGMSGGALSSTAEVYDTLNNSIVSVGPLQTPRSQHTATVLANGKILIAGGQVLSSTGDISATATAEIYDPNTQSFTAVQGATSCPGPTGCMAQPRYGHSATLLPDGRVLIAGGAGALGGGTTNTAELYDPTTQTFTVTGPMATARVFHAAAWIPSEKKVLISGGNIADFPSGALNSSEWFDPTTRQFSPGPNLPVDEAYAASVSMGPCTFCLIGGGDDDSDPINNFLVLSAQTADWTSAGALNTSRFQPTATPLENSGLLVAGGLTTDSQGRQHVSATAEVNTLTSSNTWGPWKFTGNASTCPGAAGCMVTARANHTASALPDGRVLLAGGQDDAGNSLGTTEIFDPASQTFSAGPAMTLSRFWHTATPFRVTSLTTTTTLESSQNPSVYGQPVTFTATVTSASGGTPTGSVAFNDGSTPLGNVPLTGGTASLKVPSLSAGNHQIQAVYSGSDTFAASTSTTTNQTVSMLTPSISVVSSANPSATGDSVTFTAQVLSSDGTPQGTVDFLDGTTKLATVALQGSEAPYSTKTLAAGAHSITAKYSGDSNYQSVTSPALNQTVVIKTQTVLTSSVNPSPLGQAVVFTATVTSTNAMPTGTVEFLADSITVASGVSLQGGSARYSMDHLTEGDHHITAIYHRDPNSNFSDSTSPTLTQSVLNKTTTVLTSSANPANLDQSVTLRASVTAAAGTPTGTVDFVDAGTVIATKIPVASGSATYSTSTLQPGSHSITAVFRPDANTDFATSTSNPLVQVILSTTSTVLTSSINPSTHGQLVTFTATVTGGSGTPTGTVTFTDGVATLGQAPLTGRIAVFSTATLTQGAHTIVASYSGDSTFGASKSLPFTQTVSLTTPSVTLRSSQNPSPQGQSVTFTATVTGPAGTSPTGTVVFLDGLRLMGSAPITGTTANYSTSALVTGTHSVTAAYHGDDNFSPATSQPVSQVVQGALLPSSVSLTSAPNPSIVGQDVVFTVQVTSTGGGTPTGSVTLSEGATIYGSSPLTNGGATIRVTTLTAGPHVIAATYGGDSTHTGATSPTVQQQVNAASTQ